MRVQLTKEELKTLEDVFNYAISYLEETMQQGIVITIKEDGTAEKFDSDAKYKEIESLFNSLKEKIEIKEG